VSARAKRFIVVSIGDTGSDGFDEHELPVLVKLVKSHSPDHWVMVHTGAVVHFRSSKNRFRDVQRFIADAERHRASDPRFSTLKIGLAEGELVGEFDWLGRIKAGGLGLLGDAIVEAVRQEKVPGAHLEKMKSLAQSFHGQTA